MPAILPQCKLMHRSMIKFRQCPNSYFHSDISSPTWLPYRQTPHNRDLIKVCAASGSEGNNNFDSASSSHPSSNATVETSTSHPLPNVDVPTNPNPPQIPLFYILQSSLSLAVALSGLIAVPAHLSGSGLLQAIPPLLAYFIFFALGSIGRVVKYGRLTSQQRDAQMATIPRRIALIVFILAMPAFHWAAWWEPSAPIISLKYNTPNYIIFSTHVREIVAGVMAAGAIWLNAAAAAALGSAYDRLVAPKQLIMDGPYAWIQAPIYTSYMLLFMSYAVYLNAPLCGGVMLVVCYVYYSARVATERKILSAAFGESYKAYRQSTGLFLPKLGSFVTS